MFQSITGFAIHPDRFSCLSIQSLTYQGILISIDSRPTTQVVPSQTFKSKFATTFVLDISPTIWFWRKSGSSTYLIHIRRITCKFCKHQQHICITYKRSIFIMITLHRVTIRTGRIASLISPPC